LNTQKLGVPIELQKLKKQFNSNVMDTSGKFINELFKVAHSVWPFDFDNALCDATL
jgi:hypothetical protein